MPDNLQQYDDGHEGSPFRGLMFALPFGLLCWAVIGLIIWGVVSLF